MVLWILKLFEFEVAWHFYVDMRENAEWDDDDDMIIMAHTQAFVFK